MVLFFKMQDKIDKVTNRFKTIHFSRDFHGFLTSFLGISKISRIYLGAVYFSRNLLITFPTQLTVRIYR